jgi:uncharacterized protein
MEPAMNAGHDAILADWRKNAARHDDANLRFLRRLKMVDDQEGIDHLARDLHTEAFGKIDCTRCANCCKTMDVSVSNEDIGRIAAHLGMSRDEFTESFLARDAYTGDWQMKSIPCSFLGGDDRCTIYEARPKACREFPHTDKEDFTSRSYLHSANTLRCPAVYYVVEKMKKRIRRYERQARRRSINSRGVRKRRSATTGRRSRSSRKATAAGDLRTRTKPD